MPSTAEELDRKTFFYNMLVPVMNKSSYKNHKHCSSNGLNVGMYLLFIKPEIKTPSGLQARPVLTSYYKSEQFKNRPFNKYNVITSPNDAILCEDSQQSMYCQLLCGLVQRSHVLRLGAIFASAFLRAVKFLENHFTELCADIRTGTVASWITDSGCRDSVLSILNGPNQELADEIEALFNAKSREGILKRVWPKTKYIEVIVTGSMAQYIPTLEFYSGGLPLVSVMYASSECFFGLNINPLCKPSDVSYTLLPNMAYFEFLPVDDKSHEETQLESHRIVDLVNVEIGRYYELIITTFAGQYRVGDILKVTGFHNKAPQFSFVERRNVVLSIDTDKTSEEDLMKAVTQAKLIHLQGLLLTEYTSYADTSSIPGHYVLFWELKPRYDNDPPMLDKKMMEDCCSEVEDCLDYVYRRCRNKDGSIGALEMRVVSLGTFDALMDFSISQGSSVNQYKTPRCVKSGGALQILDSRVIGKFFTKRVPQWEPLGLDS
ncbi:BnaC08g09990D [Brassica napus]|uniref:BnaC08g09990D protein n=1 Tax=Brassica napus TaxID=3708 RepID=A0A078F3H1_BRANA|nr:BnaC08g09990D [Brassica napus]